MRCPHAGVERVEWVFCGLVGAVAGRLLRSSSRVVAEVDLLAGLGR